MKAVLPAIARPLIEARLPADVAVTWFTGPDEAVAGIAEAEIAWVDMEPTAHIGEIARRAGPSLRWLSTITAGLDALPLDWMRERALTVTNGSGLNAAAVADWAVMGVLAGAKRLDEVVRAHDRREWLRPAPGTGELEGSAALIVGHGTIGRLIAARLAPFGVTVTGVTRSGRDGTLRPDAWRARLPGFDWVILSAPSTAETRAMIGADELAAMKRSAWLVNVARGDMVDADALVTALRSGSIAGAVLDVADPEPLPADHPLWTAPGALVTMHLSGRSQRSMFVRGAELFVANLSAYRAGQPMRNVVDLSAGY